MKFTNVLEDILGQRPKIKILRYLLNTGLELTGREIARAVGIHHRTAHKALKELASFGIVLMHQAGKAIVYKMNSRNLLFKEILKPIFDLEKNLLSRAITTLLKDGRITALSVIVFGSVAASSERGTSDIDALFLVSSKREESRLKTYLDKTGYDFILKYGNLLSPLVLAIGEFYARLKRQDALIQNIIQKGRSVYGKTIQKVLAGCQQLK